MSIEWKTHYTDKSINIKPARYGSNANGPSGTNEIHVFWTCDEGAGFDSDGRSY